MFRLGLTAALFASCAAPCFAAQDVSMVRVLSCQGPDAAMEVYAPQSLLDDGLAVTGYYALDLSAARKGKPLEPVHLGFSPDRKFLTVDQFRRGLPVTRVPVGGGTVNFDHRFGTKAKCGPVGAQ